jgi:hypothetical protein
MADAIVAATLSVKSILSRVALLGILGCSSPLNAALPPAAVVPNEAVAAQRGRELSTSLVPTRVLEIRRGTFRDLWRGPVGGAPQPNGSAAAERATRVAWLVILAGRYPGSCANAGGCPVQEGREEVLVDALTGEELASKVAVPAPGGITPRPSDIPCGPFECGP